MKHWLSILGENIFTLDYHRLVREPEPVLHELLSFLRLEWDVRCLDIRQHNGNVRTASVWQVRDALHAESSGRWQLYESHIAETRAWLEANPASGEAAP